MKKLTYLTCDWKLQSAKLEVLFLLLQVFIAYILGIMIEAFVIVPGINFEVNCNFSKLK